MSAEVELAVRRESGRVLATLIRLLGDVDAAEEVLQDALLAAVERWPFTGVPVNAGGWLMTAARNRAIDRLRAGKRHGALLCGAVQARAATFEERGPIPDDRLRLIFVCCHPALSQEAQVALTLRLVAGLSTAEVARAFLAAEPAIAQRIVRAKRAIRDLGLRFEVPEGPELGERLPAVLQVIYLVFNEGYTARAGSGLTRVDLCEEAIRIAEVLVELLPHPEVLGLCSLLHLQGSRLAARVDSEGEMIPLEEQDRSRWDRRAIDRGLALIERAAELGATGPYALQAAIAGCHAQAPSFDRTDWKAIARLYAALGEREPSAIVELNRAVAVGMAEGPQAGLAVLEAIPARALPGYHLLPATRADLLRRLGRLDEAAEEYGRAIALATNDRERRYLEKRRAACA